MENNRIETFKEFYLYYLRQHSHPMCRTLHYIGSFLAVGTLIYSISSGLWAALALVPVIGYGFAWVAHFFIEKNVPATFTYPAWSLASDYVMVFHWLTGKLQKKLKEAGL